ncbi:MAG: tetratricopeptide repeat protein [Myxococcota bacterium]
MTSALVRLKELCAEVRRTKSVVKVLLSANVGAGRTHTLEQLFAQQAGDGFTCHRVPLREVPGPEALVRALSPGLPDDGEGAALVEGLLASPRLAGHDAQERRLASELLASLLGFVDPGLQTAPLDAESRREGAFAELGRWLTAAGAQGPLLIAFDDIESADGDSLALVDFLANLGDALPLLLVVTSDLDRSFAAPTARARLEAWESEPGWQHLTLEALPPDALREVLSARGLTPDAVEAIIPRAKGNPGTALRLASSSSSVETASPGELRLEEVRGLGAEAFALARFLAPLAHGVPLAALPSVEVPHREALGALEKAGVLRRTGRGEAARLCFVDLRTRLALAAAAPPEEAAWARAAVAEWARGRLEEVGPVNLPRVAALVPLALPALSDVDASLWSEAHAAVLAVRSRVLDALSAAAMLATGVRRLVLLRRVADLQVLAGRPEHALETLKPVARTPPPVSSLPGTPAGRVVSTWLRAPLDRWHALTPDAALLAVDLTRAEALSHLVKKEETQAAFSELQRRLPKLSGPAAAWLWVRWAKSWSWFLCEILRRPQDALKVCEAVRAAVPAEQLKDSELALGLVRAEEVAASSFGDFSAARAHVEEHLRLAQSLGNLREGCLAWNARAILHFGQGELAQARRAFEKAVEQARAAGWLRREAISTHNLALVLTELGAYDEAHAAETRKAKQSVAIGNQAGAAEAPAVLAGVALGRRDLGAAEAAITQAYKAAETNGWAVLLAWARVLSARLRVLKYLQRRDSLELTRARNDFLAALETLEEQSTAWSEELDPGEVYALYAAVQRLSGQEAAAKETLARAERLLPKENEVSRRALAVGRAYVEGAELSEALSWFAVRGYVRLVDGWRTLAG